MTTAWARFSRKVFITPAVAVGVAAALLLVSLGLGLYNEQLGRTQAVRQAEVQAEILAGSVAAPLAFDDRDATQEYVNALRANPAIEAAGAYDAMGRLAAGFRQSGEGPPAVNRLGPATFARGDLTVTAPVAQGTTRLGSVYLRVATESLGRRAARYIGIGAIVIMASLLVAVLGASHASLREAHLRLQREIAERETAEAALRQAQKMEAMGQLTGGVAHDFNNLLMVASGALDMLQRTKDPARQERLMQSIRQAIDRGASLTQQLLAFARRAPVHPTVLDIRASLAGVRELLDRSLREDIDVEIDAAADLWPIEVDPSQFELALLNTAINARDAMPTGGLIRIKAENHPAAAGSGGQDMVRICITDTGEGAPIEVVSRVFEPFFTTKGVGQGTGLGLSQVYGFARSSGGDVGFESEVGRGSTVCILIPRCEKPLPARAAAPPDSADETPGRRRILMVEDDDKVAELVGEMLTSLGHDVRRAHNAAEALALVSDEFDLVFSDMVMPGEMDGRQLAEAVRSRLPDLPVVLTTGYSAAAASAASQGMRVLLKPYSMDALAAEMKAALARR